jgi:antitoxin ParD1/3/4
MPAKHTKGISLTPELDGWVDDLVASGEYGSASEVVREALRGLKERRERRTAELEAIRATIREGVAQLDRGEVAEGTIDEIAARALKKAKERVRQAS